MSYRKHTDSVCHLGSPSILTSAILYRDLAVDMRFERPILSSVALLVNTVAAKGPFLTQIDNQTWVFGNDHWNVTEGPNYATKLYSTILPGQDLVGDAYGHYSDVGM